jgi:ferredoxin
MSESIPEEHVSAESAGDLLPLHKFNGGRGATLCHSCRVIINEGFSEKLFCDSCEKDKSES